jgi:hypothetical protein
VTESVNRRLKVPVYLGEGPDRIEIGGADVEQATNGGLIVNMFLTGMWTDPAIMSECLQMKGFIRAEMRKD